jgi:hypothetical protein
VDYGHSGHSGERDIVPNLSINNKNIQKLFYILILIIFGFGIKEIHENILIIDREIEREREREREIP